MWPRNLSRLLLVTTLGASLTTTATLRAQDADGQLAPITDKLANSPKEELRQTLFRDEAKAGCVAVKADPRGNVQEVDKDLDKFLKQAIAAIKAKKDADLQPLFHKRLNTSLAALADSLAKLDLVYGAPFDVSVYKLWALNTVDGSPTGLACAPDGVTLYPLYGYPLEFAVWLQVMGQKEIGRILLVLVPADGKWNIGAYHMQQWTHAEHDAAAWVKEALDASKQGHKEAAFVKLDLAAKLLDAGRFMDIADQADVIKARDAIMGRGDFEASVKAALKGHDLPFVTTLLVLDGAGLLVRERVAGEISVEEIKKRCSTMAHTLAQKPWAAPLSGMRCSFLLPKEPAEKEGALGGIYVSFADAKKQAKKVAKQKN